MRLNDLLKELEQYDVPEFKQRSYTVLSLSMVEGKEYLPIEGYRGAEKVHTLSYGIRQRKGGTTRPRRITHSPEIKGITAAGKAATDDYPIYPTISPFVEKLIQIIESVGYENVEIQSIERQETTRVPFSVINFTFGDPQKPRLRQWLIKDYQGHEDVRQKDILLPAFMHDINVPTGQVVGFDYEKMAFDNRFALIESPLPYNGVWFDPIGESDYKLIIPSLNQNTLVRSGKHVIDLMALMHVRATKHLGMLKAKYGLELEATDHEELITERLLRHLDVKGELAGRFARAYALLDGLQSNTNVYFTHADYTPNNIRRGDTLADYYVIDWETARKGDYSVYDLRTFEIRTLSLRQDRASIEDFVISSYDQHYFNKLNEIAGREAPELMLNDDGFHSDNFVEYIREHFYRIGDQIWTQLKYGQNDQRKFLSQWSVDKLMHAFEQGMDVSEKHRGVLLNLKEKTVALLKNSENLDYLKF